MQKTGHCLATITQPNGEVIQCPECVPMGSVPYCTKHLENGDPAVKAVEHETIPELGKVLIATRDLPKGYRLIFWGTFSEWNPELPMSDFAMEILPHCGVIDPTKHKGSMAQYAACPGPDESRNLTHVRGVKYGTCCSKYASKCRCTMGATVGVELELCQAVSKDALLLLHYRQGWFSTRDICRSNVGTAKHPAPLAPRHSKQKTSAITKRHITRALVSNACA